MNRLIWILILSSLVVSHGSEEPAVYHFTTWSNTDRDPLMIQNYRFRDRILQMQVPQKFISLEAEDGSSIQLASNEAPAFTLEMRFVRLDQIPNDDGAAQKIYEVQIKDVSPLMVRSNRVTSRFVPSFGSYARSYYVAPEGDLPVREIHTFFVHAPYLYRIILKTDDQIAGSNMSDCSKIIHSMSLESRQVSGNSNATSSAPIPAEVSPAATTKESVDNTSASSASSNEVPAKSQNTDIQKMISEAYGKTTPSVATQRGDRRVSTGDGTSPISESLLGENPKSTAERGDQRSGGGDGATPLDSNASTQQPKL